MLSFQARHCTGEGTGGFELSTCDHRVLERLKNWGRACVCVCVCVCVCARAHVYTCATDNVD